MDGALEQFDRRKDGDTPRLVRSTCRFCYSMAGASADPRMLKILEDAHQCPRLAQGLKSSLRPPLRAPRR